MVSERKHKRSKTSPSPGDTSLPHESESLESLKNKERAYIAASRRTDRSDDARIRSAHQASAIHFKRTGKSLLITREAVLSEAEYQEVDNSHTRLSSRAMSMEDEKRHKRVDEAFAAAFPTFRQSSGPLPARPQSMSLQGSPVNANILPNTMPVNAGPIPAPVPFHPVAWQPSQMPQSPTIGGQLPPQHVDSPSFAWESPALPAGQSPLLSAGTLDAQASPMNHPASLPLRPFAQSNGSFESQDSGLTADSHGSTPHLAASISGESGNGSNSNHISPMTPPMEVNSSGFYVQPDTSNYEPEEDIVVQLPTSDDSWKDLVNENLFIDENFNYPTM